MQCPHKESFVSTAISIKLLSVDETLFALFGFATFLMDFTVIINKLKVLPQSMNLEKVGFSGVKAHNRLDNRSQIYMSKEQVYSKYFLY